MRVTTKWQSSYVNYRGCKRGCDVAGVIVQTSSVCLSVCLLPLSWPNGQTHRLEFCHGGQVGTYAGQVHWSSSQVKGQGHEVKKCSLVHSIVHGRAEEKLRNTAWVVFKADAFLYICHARDICLRYDICNHIWAQFLKYPLFCQKMCNIHRDAHIMQLNDLRMIYMYLLGVSQNYCVSKYCILFFNSIYYPSRIRKKLYSSVTA